MRVTTLSGDTAQGSSNLEHLGTPVLTCHWKWDSLSQQGQCEPKDKSRHTKGQLDLGKMVPLLVLTAPCGRAYLLA